MGEGGGRDKGGNNRRKREGLGGSGSSECKRVKLKEV